LPVQIPAVGLDELDDLADRHGLAQRRVSGIGIRLQRSSLPVPLQGVFHLRRLTIARWLATIRFPFRVGAWGTGEKGRDEEVLMSLVPTKGARCDRAHAIKKRPPSGDGRKTGAFLS
jgi:hypothetical protein